MIKIREKTLAGVCLAASAKYKEKPALAMFGEGKLCRQLTYSQLEKRSRQIGSVLKQIGIAKGGRVLLLSENCPEWAAAYFGISFAGAVSVPVLTGFSAEQIQYIAYHSNISAVCLTRTMTEKTACISKDSLIPFIYIDSLTQDEQNIELAISYGNTNKMIRMSHNDIDMQYSHNNENDEINENELASVIFTSGTQGSSKGVMLSGANIISCAVSSLAFKKITVRDRFLSVLPLAHAYECSIGFIAPLISGAGITYLDKPPSSSVLMPAVKTLRPTAMFTVPLFIEKIYNNEIAPKLRNSKLYNNVLTKTIAIRAAGLKLKKALGGKIRIFGIGGAPLAADTEKFLHKARFPYTIGYGLTEAAPLAAGNIPGRVPLLCAGKAPKGVSLRIAECDASVKKGEGEIQIRGPNVMMGYYNDEQKTAEAFTQDGWLRSGDLGTIDKKGRLRIKGRIKTIILGSSGENIYPEEIEGLLGSSQLVEDALVYSGEKGELVALISLTEAAKTALGAIEHAIEHSIEDLRLWANKKLASFSRLNRIEIKNEPFEKTPTMKIKRYLYGCENFNSQISNH